MIIITIIIIIIIIIIIFLCKRNNEYEVISTNINTDNYKTNVNIYKPKNTINEVLFLLHGTPLDQTCMTPLVIEFMKIKNLAVITYDIRGHGTAYNSQIPFVDNTQDANNFYMNIIYDDFIQVKNKVYDILKLNKEKKYNLCGWSFGGICSQGIALNNTKMVKSLNILSSVGKGRIAAKPVLDNLIQYRNNLLNNKEFEDNIYIGIPPEITKINLDKWFDTNFINSNIYLNTQKVVQGSSITNYINTYSTIINFDFSTLWKDQSYPVFIFSAPDDPVGTPQSEQDIYDYITTLRSESNKNRVKLFKAKDGKHAKCIEDPSLVVNEMNL
jgi:pimeloyl-ACP methyl ester carboxylesterase